MPSFSAGRKEVDFEIAGGSTVLGGKVNNFSR